MLLNIIIKVGELFRLKENKKCYINLHQKNHYLLLL